MITIALLLNLFALNPATDSAEHQIRQILAQQQDCWNQGDLECFMDGYWNSDSLRFIGSSGINYGWQATLDNYKRTYPDKAAMGTLNFELLNLEPLGNDHYLVTGKWKLIRESDTPNGLFTLIWKRFGDEWKIIYDHSS
ncbi:MAG: nuclear transport factor 2 family protein [Bacteroidetes bacterium]|nr:MAG: nuclear transport factor 2 family protein [Bacteroidota bacterium]